jgi:hypothetical protein
LFLLAPESQCWLYYPEDDCPFYRCTVFSHYAKKNAPADDAKLPTLRHGDKSLPVPAAQAVPVPGPYWSLMFEVSENAEHKPVNLDTIVEETIQGAINTQVRCMCYLFCTWLFSYATFSPWMHPCGLVSCS